MRKEEYTFPATSDVLSSYRDSCTFSQVAFKFLSENLPELANDYSCVQVFVDSDEMVRYAWCFIQRIASVYWLRIIHLEDSAYELFKSVNVLCGCADSRSLDCALDVLDSKDVLPPQASRDVIRYVKDKCYARLLELSCLDVDIGNEEFREHQYLIHELMAYCRALGA
ncbi:hypothetical protein QZM79_18295 [Burkholderia multivorans]|nr:hypothetical protein [Burkholderia multivorans]